MGPDERIYIADRFKPYLHVIHYPNGEGVQCNLQQKDFNLTATTNSGVTSQWGLPNAIPCTSLSCDRSVYVTPRNRFAFSFDFVFNNFNDLVETEKLSYTGEIYKYDKTQRKFINTLWTQDISQEELKNSNTHKLIIPLSQMPDDSELLVKNYFQYDVNTFVSKQLGVRIDNKETYRRGNLYGLYVKDTDSYFVNVYEAAIPKFSNNTVWTNWRDLVVYR